MYGESQDDRVVDAEAQQARGVLAVLLLAVCGAVLEPMYTGNWAVKIPLMLKDAVLHVLTDEESRVMLAVVVLQMFIFFDRWVSTWAGRRGVSREFEEWQARNEREVELGVCVCVRRWWRRAMAARKKKSMKVLMKASYVDGWGWSDDTFYDKLGRDGELRQHVWVWNDLMDCLDAGEAVWWQCRVKAGWDTWVLCVRERQEARLAAAEMTEKIVCRLAEQRVARSLVRNLKRTVDCRKMMVRVHSAMLQLRMRDLIWRWRLQHMKSSLKGTRHSGMQGKDVPYRAYQHCCTIARNRHRGITRQNRKRMKMLGPMLAMLMLMAGTATWGVKGAGKEVWMELRGKPVEIRINFETVEDEQVTRCATVDDYEIERTQQKEVIVLEEGERLIP